MSQFHDPCRACPTGPAALARPVLLLLSLALLTVLAACGPEPGQAKPRAAAGPVPVTSGLARMRDVPLDIQAVGNVEANATVEVKARQTGEIVSVHFKEGQDVKKGQLLFTIDPRPAEAELRQARATLARDKAQHAKAREDERRMRELLDKGFVSREQFDENFAEAAALKATVEADQAAVENAELALSYCYVRAPLSGRAGTIQADPGTMISAGGSLAMVVIDQIEPIKVAFSVPEGRLPAIQARLARGRLAVQARPQGLEAQPAQGVLDFVDNSVDTKTGTIRLKASFANHDRSLWPGQFVDVVVRLDEMRGVVTVPAASVLAGQEGSYVYVVGPESRVEYRVVKTGPEIGPGLEAGRGTGGGSREGREVVVLEGVASGERVVTDGQLKLKPGSIVEEKAKAGGGPGEPGKPGRGGS